VADDEVGPPDHVPHVFFNEEDPARVYRFNAEPNGGTTGPVILDSSNSLAADAEGITVYHTPGGGGYLIASSQGPNHFDVYSRQPPYNHVFEFKVSGASSTDGIDVANVNLGPSFPQGAFLAHSGGSAIKVAPWQAVAASGSLIIDTSWDPRGGTTSLLGDVDGNGTVNLGDLRELVRMFLGQVTPNDTAKTLAEPADQLSLPDARALLALLVGA
jgi:hypothetical protein